MAKMELTIKNPFVTKNLRHERKPTVFRRVISRLSEEGLHPGQIIPIFIKFSDDFKIFGALTFNIGGSISFFPDFHTLNNFDHLTLSTNFVEKKGHLTKSEGHKKFLHLEASLLETGCYHLITFAFNDDNLLMDAPPEIYYTEIEYNSEEENQKYNAWLDQSVTAGHCILDFPQEVGFYCIQILVLAKGSSIDKLAVDRVPIERLIGGSISLEKEIFNVRLINMINTPEKADFTIHIITFKVNHLLENPFGFVIAADKNKSFPKKTTS